MLLIVAFALFLLIIVAWVAAPTASAARRHDPAATPGLTAMGSHTA